MNALVVFRANGTGTLTPTPAQRQATQQDVWALARATLLGPLQAKAAQATADSEGSRVVHEELGRDTFLQLLVYQMQNQDPLEPLTNENMIAQLAQFTALEQMNKLNESFESLSATIRQQSLLAASNLIGRSVQGTDRNGAAVSGLVDRVYLDGDTILLGVGEHVVAMGQIKVIE